MDDCQYSGEAHISAVIFDLDGTLLNTEQVTKGVLKEFLALYGKIPDREKENKRLGMTQKEAAIAIVKDYELPLTPDQFTQEIFPFYQGKWMLAKALPGANRLMGHLRNHRIPFALASNSVRKNIDAKISQQEGWNEYFTVILGSDQVKSGKPSPDIFLEAASIMGVDAVHCLVIEDSLVGVTAAKAAGMKVIAVPSLHSEADKYTIADCVLHSLLEFTPELWGLPSFKDWVSNALPVEPIYLMGLYTNGLLHEYAGNGPFALPDQLFGVFFGWAKLTAQKVFKIVTSIGLDGDCCASKRNIRVCIVDGSNATYEGVMQVLILGYIKGSCDKGSVLDVLEIFDEDKCIASAALDYPEFSCDKSYFPEVPTTNFSSPLVDHD